MKNRAGKKYSYQNAPHFPECGCGICRHEHLREYTARLLRAARKAELCLSGLTTFNEPNPDSLLANLQGAIAESKQLHWAELPEQKNKKEPTK